MTVKQLIDNIENLRLHSVPNILEKQIGLVTLEDGDGSITFVWYDEKEDILILEE